MYQLVTIPLPKALSVPTVAPCPYDVISKGLVDTTNINTSINGNRNFLEPEISLPDRFANPPITPSTVAGIP